MGDGTKLILEGPFRKLIDKNGTVIVDNIYNGDRTIKNSTHFLNMTKDYIYEERLVQGFKETYLDYRNGTKLSENLTQRKRIEKEQFELTYDKSLDKSELVFFYHPFIQKMVFEHSSNLKKFVFHTEFANYREKKQAYFKDDFLYGFIDLNDREWIWDSTKSHYHNSYQSVDYYWKEEIRDISNSITTEHYILEERVNGLTTTHIKTYKDRTETSTITNGETSNLV